MSPYATAAQRYLAAGWNPLPIPERAKTPPPPGFTGDDGREVSAEDVERWGASFASSNLGVRLPRGVVGIDVDHYGAKRGAEELTRLEADLGPLPPTWASSSRDDGVSGIWLYRLPEHRRLIGKPCADVEVIQWHHRYAVVWPSIHPEGRRYRWYSPSGELVDEVPAVADLAILPDAWLEYLTESRSTAKASERGITLVARRGSSDQSTAVAKALGEYHRAAPGGRHDAMVAAVCALARLQAQEHPGASAGLDEVRADFLGRVTEDGSRSDREAEREYEDALASAERKVAGTPSYRDPYPDLVSRSKTPPPNVDPETGEVLRFLPDAFWTARPHLEHIRQAAQSRMVSPDATLAVVLARVSASVPPTVTLPLTMGGCRSLNFNAAIVGPSGAGKSGAKAVGRDLVPITDPAVVDDMVLGSGEGLVDIYLGAVEETDENGKKVRKRRQVRTSAFFFLDEGQALAEMASRKGATLLPTIRSAWVGETLGQANASAETFRHLPADAYRSAVVIAFQPSNAADLLADVGTGTPQRFEWMMATDPSAPDATPAWPGRLDWSPPNFGHGSVPFGRELSIAPEIIEETRRRRLARVRGGEVDDALESHADLARLKVAGLLAILDGRYEIAADDWSLAAMVRDTTRAVRTWVASLSRADAEQRDQASTARLIRREAALVDNQAERARERMAGAVARHVHRGTCHGGCTRRCVTQSTAGRDRQLASVDEALGLAQAKGWVIVDGAAITPGGKAP